MRSQFGEQLLFGRVGRELADQFAFLRLDTKLFQMRSHVLHGQSPRPNWEGLSHMELGGQMTWRPPFTHGETLVLSLFCGLRTDSVLWKFISPELGIWPLGSSTEKHEQALVSVRLNQIRPLAVKTGQDPSATTNAVFGAVRRGHQTKLRDRPSPSP